MMQCRVTFSSDCIGSEESPFSLLCADVCMTVRPTKVRRYIMNVYLIGIQFFFQFVDITVANSHSQYTHVN